MMFQLEIIYDRLQSLNTETLVKIINEAYIEIPDNEYKDIATDVLNIAKAGNVLSRKQKRVLVNIICQP